jgi:hypothetical protein
MSKFEVRKKKSIHLKWREQSQSRAEQSRPPIPACDNVRIPEVFELLTAVMPNY